MKRATVHPDRALCDETEDDADRRFAAHDGGAVHERRIANVDEMNQHGQTILGSYLDPEGAFDRSRPAKSRLSVHSTLGHQDQATTAGVSGALESLQRFAATRVVPEAAQDAS
jgi:hypothetical protein